ncbi:hypothetical protein [Duganella sp. HH105]|uniref:hypothetical protein n=1 Tax=Duganella sp. HH105 TaxID=1781067 RepID=UPI0008938908|nr:hypothetical protein [Duganella sp. HH105]OEZ60932.1 hypothetical protein DUGA6_26160 [Duganella sp. HH105]
MMRFRWGVMALVLALAGCGGPQIVAVQGTGAQAAIEQKSLQIVFSGKTSTGWTKHERSAVQSKPVATEQEQQAASARGNEKPGWSRIVHIQASRFATAESVARELADAMLAQLKASALVQ